MSIVSNDDEASEATVPESAKRKQILDGARRMFLARGFEAASMGEIAREAGVSKGTLYVYFDSKERLFAALVDETKQATMERLLQFDDEDADVAATLTRFAEGLITKMSSPDHVSLVRMVVGASERFPDLARSFFEAGPAYGARRLTTYLEGQRRRGRLSLADPETAAWQFIGSCNHPTLIAVLLAAWEAPDADRVRELAAAAVDTFIKARGTPQG